MDLKQIPPAGWLRSVVVVYETTLRPPPRRPNNRLQMGSLTGVNNAKSPWHITPQMYRPVARKTTANWLAWQGQHSRQTL